MIYVLMIQSLFMRKKFQGKIDVWEDYKCTRAFRLYGSNMMFGYKIKNNGIFISHKESAIVSFIRNNYVKFMKRNTAKSKARRMTMSSNIINLQNA